MSGRQLNDRAGLADDDDTGLPVEVQGAKRGRPPVLASHFAVSSSHQLATMAGIEAFRLGGNAIDAGVAAGIALCVVAPNYCNFGGVAPMLVLQPGMDVPVSIDGLGRSSRHATLEAHRARFGEDIPSGAAQIVVPAAPDAWLSALERFGTLSLREVLGPAISLAEGFPVHETLSRAIKNKMRRLQEWPASAEVFLPNSSPIVRGDLLVQPRLRDLFVSLIIEEAANSSLGREGAIRAARDHFYKGEPARIIASFVQSLGGFLDYDDIAEFEIRDEAPIRTEYRELGLYTGGPWCQGPMLGMALNIVETQNLGSYEHNSAEYVHFLTEALKLAFADRDAYFGDPNHVDVPITGLISKAYGEQQAKRIVARRAEARLPSPGDPWLYEGRTRPMQTPSTPTIHAGPLPSDTTYVCAMDADGNAFSATPSDPGFSGPFVPGLGILASHRGSQFWLDAKHPSVLAPRKRPRLTPSPAMAISAQGHAMTFGTPGGDAQPQAMLQFLCNVVDFGMDLQAAIEAPRFRTWSHQNSFWPHASEPGVLAIEAGVSDDAIMALEGYGHLVRRWPRWTPQTAGVCAIQTKGNSALEAGADPRRDSVAAGF